MTLFSNSMQAHLTPGPFDRMAKDTFPGQAHFAGTGPELKTCRECAHWDHAGAHDYRSKRGMFSGLIQPARCRQFKELTGTHGDKVPDDAAACKHFSQATVVPNRFVRR